MQSAPGLRGGEGGAGDLSEAGGGAGDAASGAQGAGSRVPIPGPARARPRRYCGTVTCVPELHVGRHSWAAPGCVHGAEEGEKGRREKKKKSPSSPRPLPP